MNKIMLVLLVFISLACQEKKTQTTSDTFYISIPAEPPSLNPLTSNDGYQVAIQSYILEELLRRNVDTNEWEPSLAESWEISADKKTFTFKIRQGVKWSDGKPLTVEDVKYSFDAIFDPELNTAHMRPYYENISKVEIVNENTVRFHVKDAYFKNFDSAAGLTVIPKHFYSDPERKKEHNKVLIGSGPYEIDKYEKGKRMVLKRKAWWGDDAFSPKEWRFNRIVIRFIKEDNVALESLKKGDLDYLGLRPEMFAKRTDGPEWGDRLIKVQTTNKSNKGYTFIGWNLKNPILKDKKVRLALAMLYNRDLAMEKFEFNLSDHAVSPFAPTSEFNSPRLNKIEFSPEKALQILKSAGWSDTDGDGVLDKVIDGKKMSFNLTILEPSADYMKYLTIYKEEAKKIGIELEIKQVEWNSFLKLMDERKFDAMRLAWGPGGGDPDLKQIWHTASQDGGSNFIAYENKEVDKLIDQARLTYDRAERIKLNQKIVELIADDYPYLFLFAGKNTLYAHNNRIIKDRDTYGFSIGNKYWSLGQ
jgi:ABC-type transport system substrate-binding protein